MKVVFCIYDFIDDKLPLQPWLTIDKVAAYLCSQGHEIHIVTDNIEASTDAYHLHIVSSLRASNRKELYAVLDVISPDVIVTLITPLNLMTGKWLKRYRHCTVIAFSSYPFYRFMELLRAIPYVGIGELKSYLRHLLAPAWIWKKTLEQYYSCVICQSDSGRIRLLKLIGERTDIFSIPPGINLTDWPYHAKYNGENKHGLNFLYLGAASDIRGFGICLDAVKRLPPDKARLTILARGASKDDCHRIQKRLEREGIADRTILVGGWMDRAEIIGYISKADAVVLPFVLVPSELPVSVMEVIACGTPVVTTNIDGLPSTVGQAGVIVKQASSSALVSALLGLCDRPDDLKRIQQACLRERNKMYDWDHMNACWAEKISCHEK